jgi:hypothetical protein
MKVRIPYKMSNKQKKAMHEEIKKQVYAARAAESIEYDAAIMWALHLCFGFGEKRLKKFFDFFCKLYNHSGYWQFGRNEIELLKGIGVDIVEWNRRENSN